MDPNGLVEKALRAVLPHGAVGFHSQATANPTANGTFANNTRSVTFKAFRSPRRR